MKSFLSILLLFNHSLAIFLCLVTIILLVYLDVRGGGGGGEKDQNNVETESQISDQEDNCDDGLSPREKLNRDKFKGETVIPPTKCRSLSNFLERPKYLLLIIMLVSSMIYFILSITVFVVAHDKKPTVKILPLYQVVEFLALLSLYTFAAYVCDTMKRLVSALRHASFFSNWILVFTRARLLFVFFLVLLGGIIPLLVEETIILPNVYIRLAIDILLTPVLILMILVLGEQLVMAYRFKKTTASDSNKIIHALLRLALITFSSFNLLMLNYWAVIRRLINDGWKKDASDYHIIQSQINTGKSLGVRHFYGVLVSIICITMLLGENVKRIFQSVRK